MIGINKSIKPKTYMHVCMLIDAWEPIWGGGQTHAWELSKKLVTIHNCNIDIFTRDLKAEQRTIYHKIDYYREKKINIFRIGPKTNFFNIFGRLLWLITSVVVVIRQHQKNPYQLIHAHAYISAIPAKLAGFLLRIPVVFTVHGSNYLDSGVKNIHYYIEKYLLTGITFDGQISVSSKFLKYANKNQNIQVIPNAVIINNYRSRLRKKKGEYFILLWVGRFDQVKAVDVLIEAFSKTKPQENKLRLILAGYGYEEAKLKNLVKKMKLEEYIFFIGKQTQGELRKLYHEADIFVLPSKSEGLSMTLLEAMAAQLPVIITPVGDHCSLIRHNYNGYVMKEVANINELSNLILKAKKNSRLKLFGLRSGKIIKKYSWNVVAYKTKLLYESIIQK